MNDQFTLYELIGLLSQRNQMKQADAEAFVQTFFALIKETLVTDKYVKVKGLGTFKLIDARESIEANADESVGMQAHLQISFTPDVSMRDAVNKPFNHFETILLSIKLKELKVLVASLNLLAFSNNSLFSAFNLS